MKPVVVLLSCLFIGAMAASAGAAELAAAAATKPDLAKGQAISASVCIACHTSDGTRGAAANPILQGQHAEYLVRELADFKSGKRQSAIMQGFASMLSAEDMQNVAAFYASKKAVPGFAKSKDLAHLGEQIYLGGAANRNIPACAACHGPNGAGIPVQYPRLGGQHTDYTDAQLTAFRSGARTNSVPMTGVAAYLTDHEIKALADYVAGLR